MAKFFGGWLSGRDWENGRREDEKGEEKKEKDDDNEDDVEGRKECRTTSTMQEESEQNSSDRWMKNENMCVCVASQNSVYPMATRGGRKCN